MKTPYFLRVVLFVCAACLSPMLCAQAEEKDQDAVTLDVLLAAPEVWQMSPEAFESAFKDKVQFKWVSNTKNAANFVRRPYSNMEQDLRVLDDSLEVQEAIVEFKDQRVHRVTFSLYNRGDAGEITREKYEKIIAEATAALEKKLGVKGQVRGRSNQSAVRADGLIWQTKELAALLEHSADRGANFQAQFVRLRLAPPVAQSAVGSTETKSNVAAVSRADLVKNVRKEANGDVFLEIPMVDQGQKGYCVTATCERVFRYYGIEVDQHEIAQLAATGTDGAEGTSLSNMEETLKRLQGKFKVRAKEIQGWDWREFQKSMDDYNRFAKKAGKEEVRVRGVIINSLERLMGSLDPEILRESRSRGASYEKFKRTVRDSIDKGVPLLWTLNLGLYPENPRVPQSAGSHMRLIIGYNDDSKSFIYSDSWGEGHEKKYLTEENVYASTISLHALEPIR